mgnify:CR=1 FL=1|tara:strand:+ start:181 stop:369 length:189 start_codon:yes stop_codon:yes gene_type:complete
MTNRNYLQELKEEREREKQEIKEMLEFYNSSTKINAKVSDIQTNCSLKKNFHVKYLRGKNND